MVITSLGSVGIGLVWGWLLVMISRAPFPVARPLRTFIALSLATVALSMQLYWLGGGRSLVLSLMMMALSFVIHLAWRYSLRAGRLQGSDDRLPSHR